MRSNQITSFEREFQFDRYWDVIKTKRHILMICIALALLIGLAKSFTAVAKYEAKGVLMIAPEREGVITFNERFAFMRRNTDYFSTQVRILKSRSLARRVIEELSDSTFHDTTADSDADNPETTVAGSAVEPSAMDGRVNGFLGALNVSPVTNTQLVTVTYTSRNPERAAASVNMLFTKFIEFNRELKSRSTRQTSAFITEQIKSLELRLAQKEEELQNYSKQKDLFFLSNEENVEVGKFSDLNRAFTEAQINRINKESLYRELKSKSFEDYPSVRSNLLISTLKNNYSNLEADYKQKSQVFKESYPEMTRLKSQMESLKERIRKESKGIANHDLEVARTEYETALKKERSLSNLLGSQKKQMVSSNSNGIHYKSLSIEVQNMRNLLNFLDRKQRETILSSGDSDGSQMSNIRVIDPAGIPRGRVSPQRKMILLMALMLGFGAGMALIFALDFLDNTVKLPEDIKTLFQMPPLGVIYSATDGRPPYYVYDDAYSYRDQKQEDKETEKDIEMINFLEPGSQLAECYRNIRTAILLTYASNPPRVITISSARPDEGKTATVINLAIAFQQLGKKVLIIDGDLRKSRIHKIFKLQNQTGLSDCLEGEAEWRKAVQKSGIPNLDILTAGSVKPVNTPTDYGFARGPLELLNSDRMALLLREETNREYDYIFVDSPPFVEIADPLILGKRSDGIVLVTWSGKTNRKWLESATDQMKQYDIPLLGVVLNKVKQTSSPLKDLKPGKMRELWSVFSGQKGEDKEEKHPDNRKAGNA